MVPAGVPSLTFGRGSHSGFSAYISRMNWRKDDFRGHPPRCRYPQGSARLRERARRRQYGLARAGAHRALQALADVGCVLAEQPAAGLAATSRL